MDWNGKKINLQISILAAGQHKLFAISGGSPGTIINS